MQNIVICEDNKIQRERFEKFIKKLIADKKYSCNVTLSTSNPYDVLTFTRNNREDTNIYFLDVDLKNDINGVETAVKIKELCPKSIFIFITDHPEYSQATYNYYLNALDYISKSDIDNIKERVKRALEIIQDKYNSITEKIADEDLLVVKSGSRTHNVDIKSILYIETISNSHKIKIHTINGNAIETYMSISELLDKLNRIHFIRTHKAYIVNKNHISEIGKDEIVMRNGDICLVSKKYSKGLVE